MAEDEDEDKDKNEDKDEEEEKEEKLSKTQGGLIDRQLLWPGRAWMPGGPVCLGWAPDSSPSPVTHPVTPEPVQWIV